VDVLGYRAKAGVSPDSTTEPDVALKVFVENWRWAGVPFSHRTGKVLAKRVSEIAVQFKDVPHILFNANPRARQPHMFPPCASNPRKGSYCESYPRCLACTMRPTSSRCTSPAAKPLADRHRTRMSGCSWTSGPGYPSLFMGRVAVEASWAGLQGSWKAGGHAGQRGYLNTRRVARIRLRPTA
jgi:glucose-6-phosphate 1-dehydrogenase